MWLIVVSALTVIIVLIYYSFVSSFKHFAKLGIPGPKPKFPFGNMPNVITQKRNMTYDYDDIYQWADFMFDNVVKLNFQWNVFCREFRGKAPFVGYFEMQSPSILLIDPDAIKEVLVKNFKNFNANLFGQVVSYFRFLSYQFILRTAVLLDKQR